MKLRRLVEEDQAEILNMTDEEDQQEEQYENQE